MRLIRPTTPEFERYEQLLSRRDALLKETSRLQIDYIMEFGAQIVQTFKMKYESKVLKTKIDYAKKTAARGETLDQTAMTQHVEAETGEQLQMLLIMQGDLERAKMVRRATDEERAVVDATYREIARDMHPQINPRVEITPDLSVLWNRVVIAHHADKVVDIKELQEACRQALDKSQDEVKVHIPCIIERIIGLEEEIDAIISTDPYRYRDLLANRELVSEKHRMLEREITDYHTYMAELEEETEQMLLTKGIKITWQNA